MVGHMPEPLLTTTQAAERLGISTRTLTRRVEDREIEPSHRLPGLRGAMLFDADDVDAYADRLEAAS